MYRVRVTESAKQDIRQNLIWWGKNRSVEQAEQWFDGIYDKIATLSKRADQHAMATEVALREAGYKQVSYGIGRHQRIASSTALKVIELLSTAFGLSSNTTSVLMILPRVNILARELLCPFLIKIGSIASSRLAGISSSTPIFGDAANGPISMRK